MIESRTINTIQRLKPDGIPTITWKKPCSEYCSNTGDTKMQILANPANPIRKSPEAIA